MEDARCRKHGDLERGSSEVIYVWGGAHGPVVYEL